MSEPPLISLTVAEFLKRLASSSPSPGGGAAAALCGALAAGLGQMVCELTVGRPKFAAVEAEMRQLRERFERVRGLLEQLVGEDAAAYADLSAAFKLPRTDPTRPEKIATAAEIATYVPLATAELAHQVAAAAIRVGQIGNPNLAADAAAAHTFATAAIQAAVANARANLPLLRESRRTTLSKSLDAISQPSNQAP